MKNKFAYILMGPHYDTDKHRAEFETDNQITYIRTVKNIKQAKDMAKELQEMGIGIIELCGAFGKENADEIIRITENKVGIGYVINNDSQENIFNNFFKKSK